MARIRTIKPDYWTAEKVARRLPGPDGRQARLLFVAIWNQCEDHGVARGSSSLLRSQVFPYDDDVSVADVSRWLELLERGRFILRFQRDDQSFLFVRGFKDHQRINRPSPCTFPSPTEQEVTSAHGALTEDSLSAHCTLTEDSVSTHGALTAGKEGKGREVEGKGREVEGSAPPPPRIPLVVEAPATPPGEWLGQDFWRWFQSKRQGAGFVSEKYPKLEKLGSWWSSTRMVVSDVEDLKEAVYRFADDPYWQKRDPPLPFSGFMSQWQKYMPRMGGRDARA